MSRVVMLIGLCLVFFASPAKAQDEDSTGAWALQFQVGGNFTLHQFENSTLSARYYAVDGRIWRMGVGVTGNFVDDTDLRSDRERVDLPGFPAAESDTGTGDVRNIDRGIFELNLSAERFLIIDQHEALQFFWGIGPMVSYVYIGSKSLGSGDAFTGTSSNFDKRDFHAVGIGASGFIGAEWKFASVFSLSAEYAPALRYLLRSSKERSNFQLNRDGALGPFTTISRSSSNIFQDKFELRSNFVRVGLTVFL